MERECGVEWLRAMDYYSFGIVVRAKDDYVGI
jgi:hypothetical protein